MKIISDRSRDLEDVHGILHVQKNHLDHDYLKPRIDELSDLLDKPAIKEKWRQWIEK